MKILNINLIALFVLGSIFSCKNENTPAAVQNNEPIEIEFLKEGELTLSNNDSIIKQLDIEVAKNNNERAIGLMNRSSMKENQGMIFVFEQDNNTGFWMKDTRIPLDIIYIGEDSTVISIVKNKQPFDLNAEGATAPYRYVLEVNGTMADKWGIKEGTTKINWSETK